jgi:polyhydroxyalkanoate synthesis regulator phasin
LKELLIGMGLEFMVGAIAVKNNKCLAEKVEMGVEKGKEIVEDIKNEVKSQTNKPKKQEE